MGEAEANIRKLFEEAEQEYKAKGEMSGLHIIIFDEIDAICKTRGTISNGTGVNDSIVNQLLSKIDGVESLNNILLIGMTNRPDLIDEALTRPGRLELKMQIGASLWLNDAFSLLESLVGSDKTGVELKGNVFFSPCAIGLPDENGRKQIFLIHTKQMRENKMLADDVDIDELAGKARVVTRSIRLLKPCFFSRMFFFFRCLSTAKTKNFSGAEIAGVCRSAASFATNRCIR